MGSIGARAMKRMLLALSALVVTPSSAIAHSGVPEPARPVSGKMYPAVKHGGQYMYNYYFPHSTGSTPWAPAWSPDGRSIAVGMSGSIWRIDLETKIAHELTYNGKYHSSPAFSPDGKWIVYTADDGGKTIQLEIVNVQSGQSHPLTDDAHIYTDPVFSPDGTRIAYVSTNPTGYFNVYVRAIDNGQWTGPVLAVTVDHKYPGNRLYFGPWDMHITPEWTKDGKELLVVSNRDVPLGSGNIVRIPIAPDGMKAAKTILAEQSLYRTRPDVSADGKRFVYSSTSGGSDQHSNLYLLPVSGGHPYKMTFFAHDAFHPRWSPDGEWIAYISNERGLPHLALLETHGGRRKDVTIAKRTWKRPMGVLKVATVAAGSARPIPARIELVASDGKVYAPPDAFVRTNMQSEMHKVFHSRGEFEVELPPGKASLVAVKGFELWPEQRQIDVRPGQVTSLVVPLRRVTDMTPKGWHSGSTHVHMNYGGNLRTTFEALKLMSDAEDQDVATNLIANKDNRIIGYHHFVPGGGAHPASTRDRVVIVGEEYRPPFYGHMSFLGLRDHLISPWVSDYAGTALESLYPSNTDALRKAKEQEATTGYAHAFAGDEDPLSSDGLGQGKGFIVDAALGTADAIEWSHAGRAGFHPWYAVLNNGLRVAAMGGEDSIVDLHISRLVGATRTYVHTAGKALGAKSWLQGIRAGRTMVSTGPLLEVKIDGKLPGEEIRLPATGGTVDAQVWLRSIAPLDKVELIFNGERVEEIPLGAERRSVDHRKRLKVSRSGWFHVRAEGKPAERFPLDTGFAQAFTGPIWVTVGKQPVRNLAAAQYCIKWIDRLAELAGRHSGWRSQKERDHVLAQFEEAKQIYRRRGQEAPASVSAAGAIIAPAAEK